MNKRISAIGLAVVAVGPAITLLLAQGRAQPASPSRLGTSVDEAAFLTAQSRRENWMEQVREARVQAALHGIEAGRAGFHLIRPSDDPYSGPPFSDLGCSGNVYCWEHPRLRYPALEYSRWQWPGTTMRIVPAPPAFCELSLDRVFSNKLVELSIESDGRSFRRVIATFSPTSIEALAILLEPTRVGSPSGVIDWFGTPRASQVETTEMRVVLVSDNLAYLPFVVQDVLAQGPGPTSVVIANALPEQEALELVGKFPKSSR